MVRQCLTYEKLEEKIKAKLEDKDYLRDPRLVGDEPTETDEKQEDYDTRKEAEKVKKMGWPAIDPIDVLKEAQCKEFFEWKWKGAKKCGPFEKMKELKIDNETFWGLEEGQFKDLLEVKEFGTRKALWKIITDIKEAHAKAFKKQEKLDKKLTAE